MDRRAARRYKINWVVRVVSKDSSTGSLELLGTLRDLSSTGALVYLNTSPPLGEALVVAVKLPFEKETWMSYSAKVVRVTEEPSGVGVAFKFEKLRPEFASLQV